MAAATSGVEIARQHLIDPEICIRCNTCEETCPVDAITHDSTNYVVDFERCGSSRCMACIGPCPTGAIDSWRQVDKAQPYTLDDQFSWDILPTQAEFAQADAAEIPTDVAEITAEASSGQGGPAAPPWSAAHPYLNLYSIAKPAVATVMGNHRLTAAEAASDTHHIILDFGNTAFPVLEGQTIGVLPPGLDERGKPHHVRLFSIASPRDGERPHYNNLALTVKRVTEDHQGRPVQGVASNYLCNLQKGEQVQVVGPYGASYLMPNHPNSNIIMICTGTGAAPMRAMTERRRRRRGQKEGGDLMLFFGARSPAELPYFGPLMKLPKDFIDINFAFSRMPDRPKQYVQDLIMARGSDVARLLRDENTYIYICGLKGMETGVNEAFHEVCGQHQMDWEQLLPALRKQGRYHVETY
ncbi:MAG: benzoyl-CoA 2,3-epoxidase subunit BoxA [Gammaproteobacteria bacterium]|nr:benzoyl-CoA 2,3-epoxidase subunit BoxA [Gammaproteobacteria bacterium]MCP5458261.1 benzoyl-CoA 2,3-epoxidase subunit BoxA [Gammaproteobacteria bacterium]